MGNLQSLFSDHIKQLCRRFDKTLTQEGVAALILPSGEPKAQFLDDMDYPFVVNPQFKLWAPITDTPHCWVVYRQGEKPQLIFHEAKDFWHKTSRLRDDFWTDYFDIQIIHQPEEAFGYLPDNAADVAMIGEWHPRYQGRLDQLRLNPEGLIHRLDFARTQKTAYEISCLQSANFIAAKGHLAAEAAFRSGKSELAIHLDYLCATAQMEHEVPYGNIIALNENAATLHYQHCQPEPPSSLRSFLIDAGASCRGYAADITRTYAKEADRFAEMLLAFDDLQQALVVQLKPGLDYVALHQQTHEKIAHWMADFNLLTTSAETAFEQGVTRTFLPHGLGHYLGLQVHDVAGKQANADGDMIAQPENYPFLRMLKVLDVGNVVTIEPGFYLIPALMAELKNTPAANAVNWPQIEKLIPYGGIRIEDDVVITADGYMNLTRQAFSQLS
ncbi:MAG TPA: Xaa-Pro dipeptidase [Aeromonadales bacterium]|nr:Xaa-Pro dipeptidase [Aeromonadales bacterium]